MTPMRHMADYAAQGRLALQRCLACGAVQYPPRALCVTCLADALEWDATDCEAGEVLAVTTLHHSHDAGFHDALPLRVSLIRLDRGPSVVCFLAEDGAAGTRVSVTARTDAAYRAVLTATPIAPADRPRAAAAEPSR